jgi:hypothetical protein
MQTVVDMRRVEGKYGGKYADVFYRRSQTSITHVWESNYKEFNATPKLKGVNSFVPGVERVFNYV